MFFIHLAQPDGTSKTVKEVDLLEDRNYLAEYRQNLTGLEFEVFCWCLNGILHQMKETMFCKSEAILFLEAVIEDVHTARFEAELSQVEMDSEIIKKCYLAGLRLVKGLIFDVQ